MFSSDVAFLSQFLPRSLPANLQQHTTPLSALGLQLEGPGTEERSTLCISFLGNFLAQFLSLESTGQGGWVPGSISSRAFFLLSPPGSQACPGRAPQRTRSGGCQAAPRAPGEPEPPAVHPFPVPLSRPTSYTHPSPRWDFKFLTHASVACHGLMF